MSYKDEIQAITKQIKEIECAIELREVEHKRGSRDEERRIEVLRQKRRETLVLAGKEACAASDIKSGDLVELKSGGLRGVCADTGARETEHGSIQVLAKVVRWVSDSDEDGDSSQLHETLVAAECLKKIT